MFTEDQNLSAVVEQPPYIGALSLLEVDKATSTSMLACLLPWHSDSQTWTQIVPVTP